MLKVIFYRGLKIHFSQFGEDVYIHKLFDRKYNDGYYIDVGAHHPFAHSNTAYLWLKGWRGTNVDANREAIKLFKRVRPLDNSIWAAVVDEEFRKNNTHATFFSSKNFDLMATCDSALAAERNCKQSISVPCVSLSEVVNNSEGGKNGKIDYLNVDIEGFDEKSLQGISLWKTKPLVISIENYAETIEDAIKTEVHKILQSYGYAFIGRVGPTSIYKKP